MSRVRSAKKKDWIAGAEKRALKGSINVAGVAHKALWTTNARMSQRRYNNNATNNRLA